MTLRHQILGLVGWLVTAFAAATVGAVASIHAGSFYAQLSRPPWAPPASLFGPVWSVLYTMMGFAAWLVWREGGWARQGRALALFLVQLVVNAAWSWLFFAWHWGAVATIEIAVLWVLIAATTRAFWRQQRLAGALLIPYLGWVSFAAALCFAVWRMNPAQL